MEILTPYTDATQAVKSLAFQSIPIAVTSTYKGMLLEEKVAPLKINPDSVSFRSPKAQICATMRTPVILHSKLLPESVRAQIQYINPRSGEICLSNFSFTGCYWQDRGEQRVEPVEPVYATLTVYNQRYRSNLANLSLHGAGLMIFLGDTTGSNLSLKSKVDLNFKLSEHNEFTVAGEIASIKFLGYSLAQAGLILYPTPNQELWLEKYITTRKMEILDELDHQVVQAYTTAHSQ